MLCRLLVDYSAIYNIYLSPERKKNDDTRTSTKQCSTIYIERYIYVSRINTVHSNKMRWKINRPKIDQIWS